MGLLKSDSKGKTQYSLGWMSSWWHWTQINPTRPSKHGLQPLGVRGFPPISIWHESTHIFLFSPTPLSLSLSHFVACQQPDAIDWPNFQSENNSWLITQCILVGIGCYIWNKTFKTGKNKNKNKNKIWILIFEYVNWHFSSLNKM